MVFIFRQTQMGQMGMAETWGYMGVGRFEWDGDLFTSYLKVH